jgi:hypothetical protein
VEEGRRREKRGGGREDRGTEGRRGEGRRGEEKVGERREERRGDDFMLDLELGNLRSGVLPLPMSAELRVAIRSSSA